MNAQQFVASLPPGIGQPDDIGPIFGGLQFKDAAPMICGVVDNGVCPDDPRVLTRLNEATKMILDMIIPVGGQVTANITAFDGVLILPKEMENVIESHILTDGANVYGDKDINQGWFEILNNSIYLDPSQSHDNPLQDLGMWPLPGDDQGILHRLYIYPGLFPQNSIVQVTGARRFLPLTSDEDYLIVQNIQALKDMILCIERKENASTDEAAKYKASAMELLQGEVKKHILDPRNYMFRKGNYIQDMSTFPPGTLGWTRANLALDIDMAMRMGKSDLIWDINKAEERLMRRGIWKDTIIQIQAEVTGGVIYFPINVQSVLALNICGQSIPIRSQFFEFLENGPGDVFSCNERLVDQGDHYFPGTKSLRRKYQLRADCTDGQTISAICKLRWLFKKPEDLMTIKNYEAIRLMFTAKVLEAQEKWQEANASAQNAIDILQKELTEYLAGIRHTIHVQTYGFGLGDISCGTH